MGERGEQHEKGKRKMNPNESFKDEDFKTLAELEKEAAEEKEDPPFEFTAPEMIVEKTGQWFKLEEQLSNGSGPQFQSDGNPYDIRLQL